MICDELNRNTLAEGDANAPINQELLLPTNFTYKTRQGEFRRQKKCKNTTTTNLKVTWLNINK